MNGVEYYPKKKNILETPHLTLVIWNFLAKWTCCSFPWWFSSKGKKNKDVIIIFATNYHLEWQTSYFKNTFWFEESSWVEVPAKVGVPSPRVGLPSPLTCCSCAGVPPLGVRCLIFMGWFDDYGKYYGIKNVKLLLYNKECVKIYNLYIHGYFLVVVVVYWALHWYALTNSTLFEYRSLHTHKNKFIDG